MFLLAKPEIKNALIVSFNVELNHKDWERIADGKEREQDKHFTQFVIISL